MSEPIGDPKLTVVGEGGSGGGRLVLTDEAVQRWVRGYERYAETLLEIAGQIQRDNQSTSFGDLDSLRQLCAGYDLLLIGGAGSLHQRLYEYSDAAAHFAMRIRKDWQRILAEDSLTADSLSAADTES